MSTNSALDIFVTGGTGYIGRNLIPALMARGHRVRVLARAQSLQKVVKGATAVVGDALDEHSVAEAIKPDDTLIHLVGTPNPMPSKTDQFEKVDLVSIRASVNAARRIGVAHLVYVSIAQPAPIMREYLWVRTLGETMIREAGLTSTILRPWTVLGPDRNWPKTKMLLYKLAEYFPGTRATAERLGIVSIEQFVRAMIAATENPPLRGQRRIFDVPAIKRARV